MANEHPEVSPEARFIVIHCNYEGQGPTERPSILTAKFQIYILGPVRLVVSRNPFPEKIRLITATALVEAFFRNGYGAPVLYVQQLVT